MTYVEILGGAGWLLAVAAFIYFNWPSQPQHPQQHHPHPSQQPADNGELRLLERELAAARDERTAALAMIERLVAPVIAAAAEPEPAAAAIDAEQLAATIVPFLPRHSSDGYSDDPTDNISWLSTARQADDAPDARSANPFGVPGLPGWGEDGKPASMQLFGGAVS